MRTPLAFLHGFWRRNIPALRGLFKVLAVRGILLGLTLGRAFLLSTATFVAVFVWHALDSCK